MITSCFQNLVKPQTSDQDECRRQREAEGQIEDQKEAPQDDDRVEKSLRYPNTKQVGCGRLKAATKERDPYEFGHEERTHDGRRV